MSFLKIINREKKARAGVLTTEHSQIPTPIFMPVGTNACVKTLDVQDLLQTDASIILGNTYHLYLQPGNEIFKEVGGIHKFMNWPKSVLTDSGGFQVFSLNSLRKISDNGVEFRSHKDGSKHFFTPEKSISIQRDIGADIIMSFDECPPADGSYEEVQKAVERTTAWAKRGYEEFISKSPNYGYRQFLFGIVQGGVFEDLREKSAKELTAIDFDGFSIGGLSVGEKKEDMYRIVRIMDGLLPQEKPRYLMGVGTPQDILEAIEHGVDMFDCVYPTRNARNGTCYTFGGKVVLKNSVWKHRFDRPIEEGCDCHTCRNYSVGYLHHLVKANEVTALRLASIHNTHFYIKLTQKARENIINNSFLQWKNSIFNKLETIVKE